MSKENVFDKLDREQPDRVRILTEVETWGAKKGVELPFMLAVLSRFTQDPVRDEKGRTVKVEKRKLVEIDAENIDAVMAGMKVRFRGSVPNRLTEDGEGKLAVDLHLDSMADFEPERIVRQVEPLRELLEAREKLSDLKNKMETDEELKDLIEELVKNTAKVEAVKDVLSARASVSARDQSGSGPEKG